MGKKHNISRKSKARSTYEDENQRLKERKKEKHDKEKEG